MIESDSEACQLLRRRQRRSNTFPGYNETYSCCVTSKRKFFLALFLLQCNSQIPAFQFGNNGFNDVKNKIHMRFDVDSASTKDLPQNLENENKYVGKSPASQGRSTILQQTESVRKWPVDVPNWAMKPPLLRPAIFGENDLNKDIERYSEVRNVAVSTRSPGPVGTPSKDQAPQSGTVQASTAEDRRTKRNSGPFYFATIVNTDDERSCVVEDEPSYFNEILMPPWLKLSSSTPLKKELSAKLSSLERSMGVYFTRSEAATVVSTISKAFKLSDSRERDDESDLEVLSQKILCIDFISLLVEYMEMSHVALCAAVWHFRTCFIARTKMPSRMTSAVGDKSGAMPSVGPWSTQEQGKTYVNWIKALYTTHVPLETKADEDAFSLLSRVISGTDEDMQIKTVARQASKLKVNEVMAEKILGRPSGSKYVNSTRSVPCGSVDAVLNLDQTSFDHLQSLLLSVNANGDWRALAIRTAACLFRLKGLHQSDGEEGPEYRLWRRNEARKALYLFAPLAHRMGMHRLKEELEREGFRILYRRQYDSIMSLYEGDNHGSRAYISRDEPLDTEGRQDRGGGKRSAYRDEFTMSQGMKSLLSDVTLRVKRVLQEDHAFMEHIASVSVTARVKEPFSLWKKMIRMRVKSIEGKSLSIFDIPDALALRVVLRARKLVEDEEDEVTKARERALCYYVQQLCEDKFPSQRNGEGPSKYKDYIKHPKPNGYQSIHYRFKMRWRGKDWPFEIQIRSAEMHRVAEYGLAAHWEYKQSVSSVSSKVNRGKAGDGYLKSVEAWRKGELLGRHHHAVGSTPLGSDGVMERFAQTGESATRDTDGNLERNAREDRKRARLERLAPYLEALSTMGTDLAREQVIVFLSMTGNDWLRHSGAIISLPAGARVLDALREGEKKLSTNLLWLDNPAAICKNGVVVAVTERLGNGDILTVALEGEDRTETRPKIIR